MTSGYRAVLDTCVIVTGLYSSSGASYLALDAIASGKLKLVLSPTLLFEYEDLLRRKQKMLGLANKDIEVILNQFCASAEPRRVSFLWRPRLRDSNDDHLVELAVAAGGIPIVTHNVRHFQELDDLGIAILTPSQILKELP